MLVALSTIHIGVNGTTMGNTTMRIWTESYVGQVKFIKISVTGASGFIASHISPILKYEGHYIIAFDWNKNKHMIEDMFCNEFHLVDFRVMDNCLAVTKGFDHVFNLATDGWFGIHLV